MCVSCDKLHAMAAASSAPVEPGMTLEVAKAALSSAIAVAMDAAQLQRLKEASRDERASLVRTALQSLHQLREHLVVALSGLKVKPHEPTPEPFFDKDLRSHRWGYVGHDGSELNTLVIRLEAPKEPLPLLKSYSAVQLPSYLHGTSPPTRHSSHPKRSALGANPLTRTATGGAASPTHMHDPASTSVVSACLPQSRSAAKPTRATQFAGAGAGANSGSTPSPPIARAGRHARTGSVVHQEEPPKDAVPGGGSPTKSAAAASSLPRLAGTTSPTPLQPWTRPTSQDSARD